MTEIKRTIKETYDASPTAGDDLSKESLHPGDQGDGTPVSFTRTQLSDTIATVGTVRDMDERLSYLETGTTPPPADDPPTFSATIPDNTLSYNISVGNYTVKAGAGWAITYDTTATPTVATPGQWPSSQLVPDYLTPATAYTASYVVRFWQYDDTDLWVNALDYTNDVSGESGTTIKPNDTNIPVIVYPTFDSITANGAEVSWVDSTDSGSGVESYDMILIDPDGAEYTTVGATSPETLTGLIPTSQYGVKIRAIDYAGNEAIPNDPSQFTTLADAGAVGTLFLSTPTTVVEGNAQTVTVNRANGDTGDVYVSVNTPGHAQETAIEGTQYYGLGVLDASGGAMDVVDPTFGEITITDIKLSLTVGEYITLFSDGGESDSYTGQVEITSLPTDDTAQFAWADTVAGVAPAGVDDGANSTVDTGTVLVADGAATGTKTFNTINSSSIYNNLYQVELTPGSEAAGSGAPNAPAIESPDAVFAQIDGSGGATDEYLMALSGSDYVAYVNAANYSLKETDGVSTWVESAALVDDTGAGADLNSLTVDTGADKTVITGNNVHMQYKILTHASSSGTYYPWIRGYAPSSSSNATLIGVNGGDNLAPPTPRATTGVATDWTWSEADQGGTQASFTATPGASVTVDLYHQEDGHSISQILLVDDAKGVFTPPDAAQTESSAGTADPTYNPINPDDVILPGLSTPVSFDSSAPADNATGISQSTNIQIYWPGSGLAVNSDGLSMTEDPDGAANPIPLDAPVIDVAGNGVVVGPTTQLGQGGESYRVQVGTSEKAGGTTVVNNVRRELANESFDFEVQNVGSYIATVNMQDLSAGTVITSKTQLETLFAKGGCTVDGEAQAVRGAWSIVNDPVSSPTRGNVLKTDLIGGTFNHGRTVDGSGIVEVSAGQFNWRLPSRNNEFYFAMDMYVPDDIVDYFAQKLPGARGTGGNAPPSGSEEWGYTTMYDHFVYNQNAGSQYNGMVVGYATRGNRNRVNNYMTTANPGDENLSELYIRPKGRWITMMGYYKNNTAYGGAANGENRLWVKDPRPAAQGGTDGLLLKTWEQTGIEYHFSTAGALANGFDIIQVNFWVGGSGAGAIIPITSAIYTDNYILSNSQIYT